MSPIIFTASSYVPASTIAPFTSCQDALLTGRCLRGGELHGSVGAGRGQMQRRGGGH